MLTPFCLGNTSVKQSADVARGSGSAAMSEPAAAGEPAGASPRTDEVVNLADSKAEATVPVPAGVSVADSTTADAYASLADENAAKDEALGAVSDGLEKAAEENAGEVKVEAAGGESVGVQAGDHADAASKAENKERPMAYDGGEVDNPGDKKEGGDALEENPDGQSGQFVGRFIKKKFGRKKYLGKVLLFEEDEGWYKVGGNQQSATYEHKLETTIARFETHFDKRRRCRMIGAMWPHTSPAGADGLLSLSAGCNTRSAWSSAVVMLASLTC